MNKERYFVYKSELTGLYVLGDNKHKKVFRGIDNFEVVFEIKNLLNDKESKINELQQLVEEMSDYIEKLGGWED